MREDQISTILHRLLTDTATSLSKSLQQYWPSKHNAITGNALHEGNISIHLGHVLLSKGWAVYHQAARQAESGWLDLLAFDPVDRTQLRVEVKRLIKIDSCRSILDDIDKINRFQLNKVDNEGAEILNPARIIGMIVALTHNPVMERHWVEGNSSADIDSAWWHLNQHLHGEEEGASKTAQSLPFFCQSDGKTENNWLLYAWHNIPTR